MMHSRAGGAKSVEQNVVDVFSAMASSLVKFEHSWVVETYICSLHV